MLSNFLSIRDAMNKLIDLDDALKGEGGNAIREHFMTLHFPAVILFNLFLEEYINILKEIKGSVESFENNNGLIREEFIEGDVKSALNKLDDLTHEIVDDINNHYNEVSDLVPYDSVKTTNFDFHLSGARFIVQDTRTNLSKLDEDSTSKLEDSADSADQIAQFVTKIQGWTKNGVFLTESQIGEVENYFMESDVIEDMIDRATELSVKQGDSTIQGDIAGWLSDLGKTNGAYNVAKGALAFKIMNSGMLDLVKDGKGNFIVKASAKWKKGSNGKYESKLAGNIYKLLKNGDRNAANPLKRYIAKSGKAPSGVLRQIIGLKGKTNRISFGKVANSYSSVLVFDKAKLKDYKMNVDVKGTAKQFSSTKGVMKLAKRIPYAGILFSVGTNSGEYFSDENKYKSFYEKSGRFAGGIGLDLGVAGLTTGGAVIGSMICPGVGTVIGGAVGAGVGIVGSWFVEGTVKEWGENAGRWVEDTVKDAGDWIGDKVGDITSNVGGFISGIFN
ncbi:LXG domain-containing protein [Lentibacillus sp. L22]|uniref:LXG domain-containing protein n=1 Tax=Lentibacillus TaxID=175304 RepID=UPI0022B0E3F6|nr:LXG domain-containing protein [Lentibacillus daqui]